MVFEVIFSMSGIIVAGAAIASLMTAGLLSFLYFVVGKKHAA